MNIKIEHDGKGGLILCYDSVDLYLSPSEAIQLGYTLGEFGKRLLRGGTPRTVEQELGV